jgi:pimeloyl-ACP methyl ester carboxylesterase
VEITMKALSTALFVLGALLLAPLAHAATCNGERVDIGGRHLWMRVAGEGALSVVFESGNGDDSSAWASVEPAIRNLGVRTVVYDRAGLGRSDPAPGAYVIDDEVSALERALDACGVDGPIVLVAHSYGGFIATLLAARNERVVGVVLVDANVPDAFDDATTAAIVAEYEPQFPALQQAAPELARVLMPIVLAYPETARRVRAVGFPHDTPVIDIVAERSWGSTQERNAALRQAHADFVTRSPARAALFAAGSGHNVMRDKPEAVIDAIAQMVERVGAQQR